ncbi:MAG TPA: glutathione S-transferase family protein [Caulobacteraceae bacterium]|jgi:glutathione S-transferase|nr:glutathione S-transferase family protein [Caulobacteraceae bacterium]
MPLELFSHPFSSYCQKVLMALYENDTPFTARLLEQSEPGTYQEFLALSPFKKFPLLKDGDKIVAEATVIIEHLQVYHPGPVRFVPQDPAKALEARFMDRVFDNYVSTPQGAIVFNAIRPEANRDPYGVEQSRAALESAYAWLDRHMATREWAIGDQFTMADCSAAPALFYADWTHEIAPGFANLRAYRARLNARSSFARCIEEARTYRSYFPLGAPDRD